MCPPAGRIAPMPDLPKYREARAGLWQRPVTRTSPGPRWIALFYPALQQNIGKCSRKLKLGRVTFFGFLDLRGDGAPWKYAAGAVQPAPDLSYWLDPRPLRC